MSFRIPRLTMGRARCRNPICTHGAIATTVVSHISVVAHHESKSATWMERMINVQDKG